MFSRSLAILLAIVGLYLSAIDAAAQPRGGGWGGHGGWGGRGGFAGAGRFGPGMGGGGRGGDFRGGGFRGGGFRGFGGGFGPGRGGFGGYQGGGYGRRAFPPEPMAGAPPRAFGGPGAGPGGPFGGDWRGQQDEVRRAVREGRHIPLGQAIEAVRRRAPGRELDAGLEPGPNGRPVYRLRWAGQNGRRQDYMVDAGTGAVLGVQGGP